jgi:hypothetical protein
MAKRKSFLNAIFRVATFNMTEAQRSGSVQNSITWPVVFAARHPNSPVYPSKDPLVFFSRTESLSALK